MSIIDTGGLAYETVFVQGIFYMITTNIDVSDGLTNGAVGKLVCIERDDSGEITFVWLEFLNLPKTGEKNRKQVVGHVVVNNISKTAVPIRRKLSTIPLNNNKTINNKKSHLLLVCTCAMTIHKSQGSTFSEIALKLLKIV